jgi:hypothetical protein
LRRFSEGARLANAEEACDPDLIEPSRENRYGLPEIACASASRLFEERADRMLMIRSGVIYRLLSA